MSFVNHWKGKQWNCKISVAAMIHSVWLKQCRTCCATVCRQLLWYGNANKLQSIFLKQFSGRFWTPKWVRIWLWGYFNYLWRWFLCGSLFCSLLLSKVNLFSFLSEVSISINVTFFFFCYFSGKYFQSLSGVEIEAEKQKTCWKQLVIFFHLYHNIFVATLSVCDRFGIWVYTAERGFEKK